MVQQSFIQGVSESSILERITSILSYQAIGQTGHLDDDAYYCSQKRLILTADMLVEGTHFRINGHGYSDIGWKAAAVNISDVAAMGGKPEFLLVSIGVPETVSLEQIDEFYQGLTACAKAFQTLIVGGDTVRSPQWVINVTAVGSLPEHHTLGTRNAARPGHRVMISGQHGLSAAGFYALENSIQTAPDTLLQAHKRPTPRVEQALHLSKRQTHYALMDTSDGLADACLKVAEQSQVMLVLEEARLPQNALLKRFAEEQDKDILQWMLYGGEDFELLATMPAGLPMPEGWYEIGRVEAVPENAMPGACLATVDGKQVMLSHSKTFAHFE